MEDEALIGELNAKIKEARGFAEECRKLAEDHKIQGASKLQKKIQTEVSFFLALEREPSKLKPSHLACSNLVHLGAIVKVAQRYEDCVSILRPFSVSSAGAQSTLVVDVVAAGGSEWVKVVARNAQGLHRAWAAGDSRRERNIADQAKDYISAANKHPHMFRKPQIIFEFLSGVPDRLAEELRGKGIEVRGEVVSSQTFPNWVVEDSSEEEEEEEEGMDSQDEEIPEDQGVGISDLSAEDACVPLPKDMPLNLDITAIFAWVSELTNGGSHFKFQETLLDEQAGWERERPVLPKLKQIMEGRKLICCETAKKSFEEILKTVGGAAEVQRSEELFKRVQVVPDNISPRAKRLNLGGKVKTRSLTIFGSGDFYQSVTVTANRGFVQAAENQGVHFAVIIHESRALSEQKQAAASPIP